jgi:hypothetical protein
MTEQAIDDGGPAFPQRGELTWIRTAANEGHYADACDLPGMSLRDCFAGLAMVGIILRFAGEVSESQEAVAYDAYRQADAMLAERKRERKP